MRIYHEEYRKLWIKAGYPGEMGSAAAAKPPTSRDNLAVYHFLSAAHALDDLDNQRIKVSRFIELNDSNCAAST